MNVDLRELRDTDLPLLLAWAHIKEIWTYLPTSRRDEQLTWEEHLKWFETRKNRVDWMITYLKRPVGVVHIDGINGECPEIGLYIGEITLWGRGIGYLVLDLAMGQAVTRLGIKKLCAVIHPDNIRSIRLFTRLGFKKAGGARYGQDLYECSLDRPQEAVPEY